VADAWLHVMHLFGFGNSGAQILRSLRLADTRDVVALAFDGHQGGVLDQRTIDKHITMNEGLVG